MPSPFPSDRARRPSPDASRTIQWDRVLLGALAAAGAVLLTAPGASPAMAQGAQSVPNQVPTAPDSTAPNAPLSEKLDRSKGVLKPPSGVDPEIHVPAPEPDPQTTPVIPPPGTPGGNQNVQPK